MADTVNEMQATNDAAEMQQGERTFTQSELNSIIEGRLKKESAKYSDYEELKAKAARFDEIEEASKSELQKATEKANALQEKLSAMEKANKVAEIRNKIANEIGIPANLLTGDTEETCKAQAEAIMAFAKPNAYPMVKDGGEVIAPTTRSTRDQFADFVKNSLNI